MGALLQGGRAVELFLVFVALEGVALFAVWRFSGRGLPPRAIVSCLVPGACLMLALRAALEAQPGFAVAGWLLAALLSHVADLALRWK